MTDLIRSSPPESTLFKGEAEWCRRASLCGLQRRKCLEPILLCCRIRNLAPCTSYCAAHDVGRCAGIWRGQGAGDAKLISQYFPTMRNMRQPRILVFVHKSIPDHVNHARWVLRYRAMKKLEYLKGSTIPYLSTLFIALSSFSSLIWRWH